MKEIAEYGDVYRSFYKAFRLQYNKFNDWRLFLIYKKLAIDIVKFSDVMDSRHGYMEKDDVSLQDVIREEYGEKAAKLIEELL